METKRGFTLIELLVVIAIVSILLSILVPSLNLIKRKAAAAICLINTKNLATGWYLYQEDNNGRIASSNDSGVEDDGHYVGWIGIPRDRNGVLLKIDQTTPPVTEGDETRGIERGVLDEYLKSPKTYHCPADTLRKSIYDQYNRICFIWHSEMPLWGHRFQPVSCMIRKSNGTRKSVRPDSGMSSWSRPKRRNWNMWHHFVIGAPEYTGKTEWAWWGPMAINHGDSSILGFCDGHSEIRKWRDSFTKERVDKLIAQGGGSYGIDEPPSDQQEDIAFMAAGWPYRYKK